MSVFAGRLSRRVLLVALLALVGLYLLWFGSGHPTPWVELAVFALPPAVLVMAALRGARTAPFWAGVFALGWFSHGVMIAWSSPPERAFGVLELALAVVIVFASSVPGIRARFGKKKTP